MPGAFSALLAIEALAGNNLSLVIETVDDLSCIVPSFINLSCVI
jgi:hypothetical protein